MIRVAHGDDVIAESANQFRGSPAKAVNRGTVKNLHRKDPLPEGAFHGPGKGRQGLAGDVLYQIAVVIRQDQGLARDLPDISPHGLYAETVGINPGEFVKEPLPDMPGHAGSKKALVYMHGLGVFQGFVHFAEPFDKAQKESLPAEIGQFAVFFRQLIGDIKPGFVPVKPGEPRGEKDTFIPLVDFYLRGYKQFHSGNQVHHFAQVFYIENLVIGDVYPQKSFYLVFKLSYSLGGIHRVDPVHLVDPLEDQPHRAGHVKDRGPFSCRIVH